VVNKSIKYAKRWLLKPIYYPYHWKNVLGISLLFGFFQVFIIIFLEPHGTGSYTADYRNLRLSGYALCYVLPFLLFHAIEKQVFKMVGDNWNTFLEIGFKLLLVLLITTASYFYNINVINTISPTFNRWLDYVILYSLPNFFIFLPLIWVVYFLLWKKGGKIVLKGMNKEDVLAIKEDSFIYAVSEKNYALIFYRTPIGTKRLKMRITLSKLHEQLPQGIRTHKSFIINPKYIERIKGGKKDRFVILEHISKPIPVSRYYDISQLV